MNIGETTQALALAQAFDNRTVGEVNIRAWHAVLGDLEAADVMEAIRDHYSGATDWIMPAHIRAAVGAMERQRARAANATGWAPGQAGVSKDQAMPEITGGGELSPEVRALVEEMSARLSVRADREKLFPRQTYWEREHRAYLRSHDGEPNPLYRPGTPCFDQTPHPDHQWRIEGDKFWCRGLA